MSVAIGRYCTDKRQFPADPQEEPQKEKRERKALSFNIFLPVGLGRLIDATLRNDVTSVNSQNGSFIITFSIFYPG